MKKFCKSFSFFVAVLIGLENECLGYSWPVDGNPQTWTYGYTFAEKVNGQRHLGVDIIKDPLTPIRAPYQCTVVISKLDSGTEKNPADGYGYYLVCTYKDPNGVERVFGICHTSRRAGYEAKGVGSYSEGTILAYVGYDDENGLGGPHLHWFDYGEPYSSFKYPGYAPNSYGTDVDYDKEGNYIGGKFTDPIKLWSSYINPASLVALYSSGTTNSLILACYNLNGGQDMFGAPWSNSSFGPYVHPWPDNSSDLNVVWLQDFITTSDHWWQIVDNPAAGAAFPVHGQILTFWHNNWGYRDYGSPSSNEYYATDIATGHQLVIQTFIKGSVYHYLGYDTVSGVSREYQSTEFQASGAGGSPEFTPTILKTLIFPCLHDSLKKEAN